MYCIFCWVIWLITNYFNIKPGLLYIFLAWSCFWSNLGELHFPPGEVFLADSMLTLHLRLLNACSMVGFLHAASAQRKSVFWAPSCFALLGGPHHAFRFWILPEGSFYTMIQKPAYCVAWETRLWAMSCSGLQRAWLPATLLWGIPGFISWLISLDSKHLLVSWPNSCSFCENNKTRLNDVNSEKKH